MLALVLVLGGGFLVVLMIVTSSYLSGPVGPRFVVEHQTSDELGVREAGEVSGLQGVPEITPDIEQEVLRLVLAQKSVIAVTPEGPVGIDPRDGTERWRYQVPGAEVAVGFPSAAESVLVMYEEKGLFEDRVSEVVLDPGTGEVRHRSTFAAPDMPGGIQDLVQIGFTDTRVLVGDQLVGYDREDEGVKLWSVDPSEYCGGEGFSREDFNVASDSYHVYISVLCDEGSEVHLAALSPSQGELEWEQVFSAEDRESPPQIAIAGGCVSAVHPVARALSGELASDYLYVDDRTGSIDTPRLYELESMSGRFPAPSSDREQAPDTLVVGGQERIDMLVTYLAANMLEVQGSVSMEDFHKDVLVREEGGPMRLTDDPAVLSSLHARNLILETLAQIDS